MRYTHKSDNYLCEDVQGVSKNIAIGRKTAFLTKDTISNY